MRSRKLSNDYIYQKVLDNLPATVGGKNKYGEQLDDLLDLGNSFNNFVEEVFTYDTDENKLLTKYDDDELIKFLNDEVDQHNHRLRHSKTRFRYTLLTILEETYDAIHLECHHGYQQAVKSLKKQLWNSDIDQDYYHAQIKQTQSDWDSIEHDRLWAIVHEPKDLACEYLHQKAVKCLSKALGKDYQAEINNANIAEIRKCMQTELEKNL